MGLRGLGLLAFLAQTFERIESLGALVLYLGLLRASKPHPQCSQPASLKLPAVLQANATGAEGRVAGENIPPLGSGGGGAHSKVFHYFTKGFMF